MTTIESPETATDEMWNLCLYVTDKTPRSVSAFRNLKSICDERLAGHYQLEVVDLLQRPERAINDQIVATPTVVRKSQKVVRTIIGDLSNTGRVLAALQL